jgi:anthranilate phosphoribosyltransferase
MKRDADPALVPATDVAALYARAIKRLGRNARDGAHGPLDEDDACALWQALLAGRFSAAQEAALLMGLRVHGEGPAVLAAFARAMRDTQGAADFAPGDRTPVVLHCLGSARRMPVLAPLLAGVLAARGVPVLLVTHDAQRGVNAAQVLRRLGGSPIGSAAEVSMQFAARQMAWWPIEAAAPALARLLALRAVLGFRNSAHSAIKLWSPLAGRSLVVANYTHAPYRATFADAVTRLGASALLVRGTEGDPVAWQSAAHPAQAWCDGAALDLADIAAASADPTRDGDEAELPAADDLSATVAFTQSALRGECRMPAAIAAQAALLEHLSRRSAR